jgi:hypothetical protein
MTFRGSRAIGPLLGGLVIAVTGCGGSGTAEVSGTVQYQGKPVRSGTVMIFDAAGSPHLADIGPDGTYAVSGVPVGAVQLSVQSPDPARADLPPLLAQKGKKARPNPIDSPPRSPVNRDGWFPLPAVYSTPASSGLSTILQPGSNSFDLDLK